MPSHHEHQNHGTLVDVVCVYTRSLPKPAPDIRKEKRKKNTDECIGYL